MLKIQEENKIQFDKKRNQLRKYKAEDIIIIKKTQFGYVIKLKDKYLG